jgi:hypothetical protein
MSVSGMDSRGPERVLGHRKERAVRTRVCHAGNTIVRAARVGTGAVALAALVWGATPSAHALTLELSGQVTLRPQGATRALSGTRTTVLLADDLVQASVRVSGAHAVERQSFSTVVLRRQDAKTRAWVDVHTFYSARLELKSAGPTIPKANEGPVGLVKRIETPTERLVGGPWAVFYETPPLRLPAGTTVLRASARRQDGTSVDSAPLPVDVRRPPAVLTILAMGGTCTDPDANTNHRTLTDAGITRDADACAAKGVQATYLGDLTPMGSVNCNNPCNAGCMNFMEHLALRLLNDKDLADRFDSIDNRGEELCQPRANPQGIRNRLVFGKWRNTDEEPVCATPIRFNGIIDDFVRDGGQSLILIGQSQGGAKLAGMVRDHWRWPATLTLELLALWDATSFDVVSFSGHPLIGSMGVRRVGSHPRHTLSFFQYSNPVPFQNGAPLLDSAEQYDLDVCFSHNGIARSQFVHHKTADAVKDALTALRDRARR